jgi:hypothetical protein
LRANTSTDAQGAGLADGRARWLGRGCVALAIAFWYWLWFLPPVQLGSSDPDRYYHLALSRLIAEHGWILRTLPQVEDLGWGHYFPDKEFLFHVLTGGAWSLGGSTAVLALVPLLGFVLILSVHEELQRVLRPLPAALIAIVGTLATCGLVFRISLLRPHLLAMLAFCLLVLAILRERPRLAGLAAFAFALGYHAYYLMLIVAGLAWLLRRQPGMAPRTWLWVLAGLCLGIVLNPYFPSNLLMSVLHLGLALRGESAPYATPGLELFDPTVLQLLSAYGFVPATLLFVAILAAIRRPEASAERTRLLFLWLLCAGFTVLATRTFRAMEYGAPCGLLLMGYALRVLPVRHGLAILLGGLLLCQGWLDWRFYREYWQSPAQSALPAITEKLGQIPLGSNAKVFNCDWEVGSYILLKRPDLRFVDLLEPGFLWEASKDKFLARQGLIAGAFPHPRTILRGAFDADYVICTRGPLTQQMDAQPEDFSPGDDAPEDQWRIYAVRPDGG